jgi:hypothetical protein
LMLIIPMYLHKITRVIEAEVISTVFWCKRRRRIGTKITWLILLKSGII